MVDDSCTRLRAEGMTLLVGLSEKADDSRGYGTRVIMVHEDGVAADQLRNGASAADHYRGCTAHSFGNDHAKGFRVTDLDIDFGSLEPTDDVRVLHAAGKTNACLDAEAGNESKKAMVGVALVSNDDELLVRKSFENDRDGTKKDFAALNANDVVIEIEDGGDMRRVAVRRAERAGIDAIRDDNGGKSAQSFHVVNHEMGDDQDNGGEAETQASSKFFVPGSREIAGRNTGQGITVEHRIVAASDDDDGFAGEASFDQWQDAATGPPGEIEIAAPRNFMEGRGDGYVVSEIVQDANILK